MTLGRVKCVTDCELVHSFHCLSVGYSDGRFFARLSETTVRLNLFSLFKWTGAGAVAACSLLAGVSANAEVNWSIGVSVRAPEMPVIFAGLMISRHMFVFAQTCSIPLS